MGLQPQAPTLVAWSQHLKAFSSFSFWMTICYIGVFHWQSCGSRQPHGRQMRWTLRLLGPSCSDMLTSVKHLVLLGWRYWLCMCACIYVGSVCVCACMHAWVCEILTAYVCVYLCVCVHACMGVCAHMHGCVRYWLCMCAVCVCMHGCVRVNKWDRGGESIFICFVWYLC